MKKNIILIGMPGSGKSTVGRQLAQRLERPFLDTDSLIEEKTGLRPEKIGIISSEYHLFRASLFANSVGVESVGIPARTSILSQLINHLMREVVGVWHYLILGGQYE